MCVEHSTSKNKFYLPLIYFIAIALGIFSGLSNIPLLQNFGLLISDIFIKIFKCISLPIIALSLIVTLSSYRSDGGMHTLWRKTIFYTLSTTLIAAALSCVLYLIIAPGNVHNVGTELIAPVASSTNYFDHLINLIPSNIFSPFLEHQVLGVLFVGMIMGIAIRYIDDTDARHTITAFFKGAHGVFLVITNWVVKIIPLGLFGFITATVVQLREGMEISGIGAYLGIVVLANVIQGLVILPIWLLANGIHPFKAMKAMLPALSLAFFSKSSAGTLPVTMKTAENNLKINPRISRFVLPLCTTINMNGCAAFIFTTVIYLMQNYGLEISLGTMVTWIFIATIAAIGNAGVPMGCFFLSASLLASMNVPIALLGIILPFYSIIDMIETALNVWSDSCVAIVIDEQAKENVTITATATATAAPHHSPVELQST
jgi:Na+/H+-dicarboxylate symporter